uniref:Uncharacterized protein n=1 Tax=viral metagenome TaxID=1070528 RepID=A0A6H1ZMK9_9ZZZZ
MYRQPIKFKADNDKVFDVKVVKTNIRKFVLILMSEGKEVKEIKVRKNSPKLVFSDQQKET